MLVELVDEVTLNRFEGLVHAIEHQIVPVWRQTHEFTKAIWVVLYEGKGNKSIQKTVLAAKFDVSWSPHMWQIELTKLVVARKYEITDGYVLLDYIWYTSTLRRFNFDT